MTPTTTRTLLAVALLLAAAGCQSTPRSRASAAASSACRTEVDRVYAAQNRVDLSLRDQRDTPFAGGYNSGITTRGLSAEYGRDNQFQSCLANSTAPAPAAGPSPGTGATFAPAAR